MFSEAQRVYDFKSVCDSVAKSDTNNNTNVPSSDSAFQKLGSLMNDSHESCSKLYDCSCSELDELVEICRESGAFGSRLTGAGWGGCAVSLIPHTKLVDFLASVKRNYYSSSRFQTGNNGLISDKAAFATKPSDGIYVITLD